MSPARDRFIALLRAAVEDGSLEKLTLGKYRGPDPSLANLFVRPVDLRGGLHLSFLWRHESRDITKNHEPRAALGLLEPLIGGDFLHAHLFAGGRAVQLECEPGGASRLRTTAAPVRRADAGLAHDRTKHRPIPPAAGWLQALGVVRPDGKPRPDMAPKLRQIERFGEILGGLLREAGLPAAGEPLEVVDMGSGKGYLTFAVAELLGDRARVRGIEVRDELVRSCNRVAEAHGFSGRLVFEAGTIAGASVGSARVVIALHACDTATDDALAKGVAAGARLLVVSPCCQKELRPRLVPPPVLAGALRHGILAERETEFVTDALRAQLLEWAGYRTRVLEFISTEHTARNLMIAAIKAGPAGDAVAAGRVRAFAAFYGIADQSLARQLGFALGPA